MSVANTKPHQSMCKQVSDLPLRLQAMCESLVAGEVTMSLECMIDDV